MNSMVNRYKSSSFRTLLIKDNIFFSELTFLISECSLNKSFTVYCKGYLRFGPIRKAASIPVLGSSYNTLHVEMCMLCKIGYRVFLTHTRP